MTSNSITPSRRSLLAGIAAAATPIAPALASAMGGLPASPTPVDPIFAVIAEHRAAFRALVDILEDHQADPAAETATSWGLEAAIRAVLTTQPTTIEGAAALLHHVGQHECLGMDREYEDRETVLTAWNDIEDERKRIAQDFPLRLASTVRAMAETATLRRIEPSEPDPIYAAIKAEREAYAPYCITKAVKRRISDQDPHPPRHLARKAIAERLAQPAHKAWWAEYQKAEDAHRVAAQVYWDAREEFLVTQPTTVAGLRAFVEHIDGFTHGEAGWDDDEKALAFPTLATAVRSMIGGAQS
jgi:hypothetical protein